MECSKLLLPGVALLACVGLLTSQIGKGGPTKKAFMAAVGRLSDAILLL